MRKLRRRAKACPFEKRIPARAPAEKNPRCGQPFGVIIAPRRRAAGEKAKPRYSTYLVYHDYFVNTSVFPNIALN